MFRGDCPDDYMYFKKGYLSSVFNYVTNSTQPRKEILQEIFAEMLKETPDYKANKFYKSKLSLKMLTYCIQYFPCLAVKLIKKYAAKKEMTILPSSLALQNSWNLQDR